MNLIWLLLTAYLLFDICESTLSKSDKKTKAKKKKSEKGEPTWETKSGPQDLSVHSRKLVNKLIQNPQEIIANHAAYRCQC